MRYGVTMFATDLSMRPDDLAREVEARGLGSLYLPEHTHIPVSRRTPPPTGDKELAEEYKRTLDPFVALTAAAIVTTKLEIGTGIALVAQRDPIVTAKAVATLDLLSGGRFVLGVGFGWNEDEAESHGLDFASRRFVAREHVLAMKALWSSDVAAFAGEHVRIAPSFSWPKPVRMPPVLLGGMGGPKLFADIAEWGDGWIPIGGAGIAKSMPLLREAMAARGRDPKALRVVPFGTIPGDPAKIAYYAENGVTETVFRLPSASRDQVLPVLDRCVETIAQVGLRLLASRHVALGPPPRLVSPPRMAKGTSRLARNAAFLAAGFVAAVASLARPDLARDEVVARYAGPTSRFASIEGMQVHYRDEGQGPPLLLLHGTSSSLHTWDGWAQRIGAGRRIVRLDLPGFGLTGPAPDHDYRSTRLARVARTLLDQLHVERADIAGNSLGGRVALTLASETPERVRRLVLVDAAGMSGQAPPPIFRLARTPFLGGLLRWITPRFLVKKNVREVYGDASRVSEPLVDRYYDLARREGNREALLRRLNGPRDPDLDDVLPRIAAPTLVQWGEKDVWIAESFGRRIAAGIPSAELVVYPGAGHVPMEEIPDETARDADAFLAR